MTEVVPILQDYMEEPLKDFFNDTLPKITDAELDIMVQYIFALLTNADENVTDESMIEDCKNQLTDFLGDHTEKFVIQMFDKIKSLKEEEKKREADQQSKVNKRIVEKLPEPRRRERERRSPARRERDRRSPRSRSRSRDRRYRDRRSTRKKRKRDRDNLNRPLGVRRRGDSALALQQLLALSQNLPGLLSQMTGTGGRSRRERPGKDIRTSSGPPKREREREGSDRDRDNNREKDSARDREEVEDDLREVLQEQINAATLAALSNPGKIDLDALEQREKRGALNFRTRLGTMRQPFVLPNLLTRLPITPPTQEIRVEPHHYRPLFPERRGRKRGRDLLSGDKKEQKRQDASGSPDGDRYQNKRRWSSYDGWNGKRFPEHEEKEVRQIFLKNIPSDKNNIGALSNFFQEFGVVEHIQVHSETNKAFVQFATREDAKRAMDCKGAVLDVPAITKLWAHYNRKSKMNMAGQSSNRRRYHPTAKQRRMQQNILNSFAGEQGGVLPPRPKKPANLPAYADASADYDFKENSVALMKKIDEKLTEIDSQMTSMKAKIDEAFKLVSALKDDGKAESTELKERVMKNLNKFTASYSRLLKVKRQELLKKKNLETRMTKHEKDPRQLASDALDRDLDLYNKIRQKRKQPQNQVLDLRSAILRIGNVHDSMNELLLKVHFQNFGEIIAVEMREDNNCAYIKFKSRADAEEALRSGYLVKNFADGTHKFELSLTNEIPTSDMEEEEEEEIAEVAKLDVAFDDI